jgi:ankyrin repeat protein
LLGSGAKTELTDAQGRNPLLAAVDKGRRDIVQELLEGNAKLVVRDFGGRTPFLFTVEKALEKERQLDE